jgi:hypothetical protein
MTTATVQLARIEARRMLRHPAPWCGLALSVLAARSTWDEQWSGQRYSGLLVAITPLLIGLSLASISAFGRELAPVAEEAPMSHGDRSLARLLGGLPLVLVAAAVVAGVAVWLRSTGGLTLGTEPGHTENAHHTFPELLQLVLLAGFAVAIGAAVVHVVRHRLAAGIVVTLGWFLVGGTYWVFNGPYLRWFTPLQVQPVTVEAGAWDADPTTFPKTWLLTQPGEYQDFWSREVVSPALAAWHDLYLVGLVLLAVAVAVPGRTRRPLAVAGAVVAVAGIVLQQLVAP